MPGGVGAQNRIGRHKPRFGPGLEIEEINTVDCSWVGSLWFVSLGPPRGGVVATRTVSDPEDLSIVVVMLLV